jgi:hypothetical protein
MKTYKEFITESDTSMTPKEFMGKVKELENAIKVAKGFDEDDVQEIMEASDWDNFEVTSVGEVYITSSLIAMIDFEVYDNINETEFADSMEYNPKKKKFWGFY